MATCVDVSGATYPTDHAGEKITPLEGRSLVPAFGDGKIERDAIYWEHEGNRAIRVGDWKLVAKGPAAPWELYDVKADRTETTDLAAQHPERVREMTAKWESWAHRAKVLPWIWKPQYGQPDSVDNSTEESPAVRFELKSGDTLARGKAPRSANKPLSIAVTISESSPNGVLIAQGGSANGYSLYVKNNKLTFAIRRRNQLATVVATEVLPPAPLNITATLSSKGAVVLTANKKQIGTGKVDGPMVSQPADGLQVGRDENGAVGDYEAPFAFIGKIDRVVIELQEP
jgi:arylsulfatase